MQIVGAQGDLPEVFLSSVGLAHRKGTELVRSTLSGVLTAGSTTFRTEYDVHRVSLSQAGPDQEVLACPECGAAVFEVKRDVCALIRWSECDEGLRAWLWAKFEKDQVPRWWAALASLVAAAAVAASALYFHRAWVTLQTYGWPEVIHATENAEAPFFGLFLAIFGGLALLTALSLFESEERRYVDSGEVPPESLLWISASSGAPVGDQTEGVQRVVHVRVLPVLSASEEDDHQLAQGDGILTHSIGFRDLLRQNDCSPDWIYDS